MDEKWVTVAEASRRLGNSKYTIYKWIRKGLIDPTYIGNLPNGQLAVRLDGLIRPRVGRPYANRRVKKRR